MSGISMDCCAPKNTASDHRTICKQCSQKAKTVDAVTLYHMLRNQFLSAIQKEAAYYFCESKDCTVVYFNNETDQYFTKDDVRIRIGLKETESPIQVCYCFDYTEESIREEVERTSTSTATEEIAAKVQAGLCACEVRNPAGRCCLGNVRATIKKLMNRFALPVT